jgi:polysaccharide deacetylase family protein (PEP-CTERM system associated)
MPETPARLNALTIDVEDWPQSSLNYDLPVTERAVRNTQLLLSILREYQVKGTFFVQGLIAENFPQLVVEIAADGHEIGSHGYSHRPIFTIGPQAFADELHRSVELLQSITGQEVIGFRAPDFSITADSLWAIDLIAEQGFRYDSSIFPYRTSRYGFNDVPRHPYPLKDGLTEVPLSTIVWAGRRWPVAGGGYLRLLPYAITRWAIQRIQSEGSPAVVYLHPYELDAKELDEVNMPISPRTRLSQGLNRRFIPARLKQLLQDFRFAPVNQVLGIANPQMQSGMRKTQQPVEAAI